MAGTFYPLPRVSDPDMHRGTCVTHVPWCMLGSLTSGFLWRRWRGKRSRHSWRMRNPQFYVSGKRPILITLLGRSRVCYETKWFRLWQYYQRVCPWWAKPSMLHIIMCFFLYRITHERNQSTDRCMCVSGDIQIKDMGPNILWTYLSGIELLNTRNLWEAYKKYKMFLI